MCVWSIIFLLAKCRKNPPIIFLVSLLTDPGENITPPTCGWGNNGQCSREQWRIQKHYYVANDKTVVSPVITMATLIARPAHPLSVSTHHSVQCGLPSHPISHLHSQNPQTTRTVWWRALSITSRPAIRVQFVTSYSTQLTQLPASTSHDLIQQQNTDNQHLSLYLSLSLTTQRHRQHDTRHTTLQANNTNCTTVVQHLYCFCFFKNMIHWISCICKL